MEEGIAPVLSSFKSREIVIVPRLTVDIEYRYITVNIVRVKMKKRNSFFFFSFFNFAGLEYVNYTGASNSIIKLVGNLCKQIRLSSSFRAVLNIRYIVPLIVVTN